MSLANSFPRIRVGKRKGEEDVAVMATAWQWHSNAGQICLASRNSPAECIPSPEATRGAWILYASLYIPIHPIVKSNGLLLDISINLNFRMIKNDSVVERHSHVFFCFLGNVMRVSFSFFLSFFLQQTALIVKTRSTDTNICFVMSTCF